MEIKIAVLLPSSDMFPTLAMDFLNGLKLSLKNSISPLVPKFIIESIGNASDKNLLNIIEKIILQDEADLVISFCSIYLLEEITSLFTNYKKPFVHVDLGGSVFKKTHASPYVIHHTLNIAHSAYAAGMYAALHMGKKGYVASSVYDGGYQITDGIVRGYEKEGGNVEKFYVSPMDYKAETFEALISDIEIEQPDIVFCIFSYKEGVKIFQKLANSSLNGKVQFMVIPLMTDETINLENYQIEKVHSMASWAFTEENTHMQNFQNSYKKAYEDSPNIIGLLGFEIGVTIEHCISKEGKITKKLMESLYNQNIQTPRGNLKYNSFNESQVETFKLRQFTYNKTAYQNIVTATTDASFSEELNKDFEDSIYSGWQNPYICT
jgi:branched-chain amino acid transport system substrate-binding protein